jgi:hypothetical protein
VIAAGLNLGSLPSFPGRPSSHREPQIGRRCDIAQRWTPTGEAVSRRLPSQAPIAIPVMGTPAGCARGRSSTVHTVVAFPFFNREDQACDVRFGAPLPNFAKLAAPMQPSPFKSRQPIVAPEWRASGRLQMCLRQQSPVSNSRTAGRGQGRRGRTASVTRRLPSVIQVRCGSIPRRNVMRKPWRLHLHAWGFCR